MDEGDHTNSRSLLEEHHILVVAGIDLQSPEIFVDLLLTEAIRLNQWKSPLQFQKLNLKATLSALINSNTFHHLSSQISSQSPLSSAHTRPSMNYALKKWEEQPICPHKLLFFVLWFFLFF